MDVGDGEAGEGAEGDVGGLHGLGGVDGGPDDVGAVAVAGHEAGAVGGPGEAVEARLGDEGEPGGARPRVPGHDEALLVAEQELVRVLLGDGDGRHGPRLHFVVVRDADRATEACFDSFEVPEGGAYF